MLHCLCTYEELLLLTHWYYMCLCLYSKSYLKPSYDSALYFLRLANKHSTTSMDLSSITQWNFSSLVFILSLKILWYPPYWSLSFSGIHIITLYFYLLCFHWHICMWMYFLYIQLTWAMILNNKTPIFCYLQSVIPLKWKFKEKWYFIIGP